MNESVSSSGTGSRAEKRLRYRENKRRRKQERTARDVLIWKGVVCPDVVLGSIPCGQWRLVGRAEFGNVSAPWQIESDGWVVVVVPVGSLVCVDRRRVAAGAMCSCEVIRQGNGLVRVNLWSRACGYAGVSPSGEVRPVEVVNAKA